MVQDYESSCDPAQLETELTRLFEYIANEPDANCTDIMDSAQQLYKPFGRSPAVSDAVVKEKPSKSRQIRKSTKIKQCIDENVTSMHCFLWCAGRDSNPRPSDS